MPRNPKTALVIFARRPRGRVKTRLAPSLTPAAALELHVACLESTSLLAASLPARLDKWLYLTPANGPTRRRERRLRLPRALRRRTQRGRDLGARLRAALGELLARGYRRVLFIGSDSPTLPRAYLRRAVAALDRADAVLGPAHDGGYYLLGLRVKSGSPPDVFRGIAWGTPRAFRQTQARLRAAGQRTAMLSRWYDVDVPADLRRLRRDLQRQRQAHLAPLRAWSARQPR